MVTGIQWTPTLWQKFENLHVQIQDNFDELEGTVYSMASEHHQLTPVMTGIASFAKMQLLMFFFQTWNTLPITPSDTGAYILKQTPEISSGWSRLSTELSRCMPWPWRVRRNDIESCKRFESSSIHLPAKEIQTYIATSLSSMRSKLLSTRGLMKQMWDTKHHRICGKNRPPAPCLFVPWTLRWLSEETWKWWSGIQIPAGRVDPILLGMGRCWSIARAITMSMNCC